MSIINEKLKEFKKMIEEAISTNGAKGKESVIRSSELINLIHDAVKQELIDLGIDRNKIYPPLNAKKPEVKMAGFLKQKDQDVCVLPEGRIDKETIIINWGPLKFENKEDKYGYDFSTNSLVINVRSQMSSLAKNADTLFERTFAEALNLHMRYKNIVLGEVYLIPVYEYDDNLVKNKQVGFKTNKSDLEKYISFFNAINNRQLNGDDFCYERCTLLIVDFSKDNPKLYLNSEELKKDKLIADDFEIEYATLAFDTFARDILNVYAQRYDLDNLK